MRDRALTGSPRSDSVVDPERGVLVAKILEHRTSLVTRARWLTGSYDQAWDLFQGTVERGLRTYSRKVPADRVRAWLLVIMQNLFIDDRRTESVRRRSLEASMLTCDALVENDVEVEPEPAWSSMDRKDLECRIEVLSAPSRAAMTMYARGASYSQIAGDLGISMRAVGLRIHRAKRRLRKLLNDEPHQPGSLSTAPARSDQRSVVQATLTSARPPLAWRRLGTGRRG